MRIGDEIRSNLRSLRRQQTLKLVVNMCKSVNWRRNLNKFKVISKTKKTLKTRKAEINNCPKNPKFREKKTNPGNAVVFLFFNRFRSEFQDF